MLKRRCEFIALAVLLIGVCESGAAQKSAVLAAVTVNVQSPGRVIPKDFCGLEMEIEVTISWSGP